VSAQSPATPTLAALRRARRRQEVTLRWLRPVALGVALLVAARTFRGSPAPGWHGAGLGVSAALAAMGTGAAGLLASYRSAAGAQLAFLCLFLAGSATVFWLQPGGAGLVGALAGVGLMARWLPARMTAVPVGLTMAAIAASAVSDRAHHSLTSVLLAVAGLAAVYGVALLANIRKHAHPDEVEVCLAYQARTVRLTVRDFGAPADGAAGPPAAAAASPALRRGRGHPPAPGAAAGRRGSRPDHLRGRPVGP
jgi:hypothetical protein